MKFNQCDVNATSLLAIAVATKVGGDIVTSLVGNDLSAAVGGVEVGGEMAYRSISSVISAELQVGVETEQAWPASTNEGEEVDAYEILFGEAGKLAVQLEKAGKRFFAKQNTPLAALANPLGVAKQEEAIGFTLRSVLENPYTATCINDAVVLGVKGTGSLISVCRNEALPIIRDVLKEATRIAGNYQRDITFPFSIVQDDLPALWRDTSFLASLPPGDLTNQTFNRVNPLIGIGNQSLDLKSMLRTGVSHLDEIIEDSLAGIPDVSWVWRVITRQGNTPLKQLLEVDEDGVVNIDNRRVYLTIAYLLARHVMAVGVDLLKPTEVAEAKMHFEALVRSLGHAIRRNIEVYDSVAKSDTVVQRKNVKGGITELVVNADTYKKWLTLDPTNTPELLYSSSELLGVRATIEKINTERVRLAANWNRIYTMGENRRISREREVVGIAVNQAVVSYLQTYGAPAGVDAIQHETDKKLLVRRVPGILKEIKYESLDDLPNAVREIVCTLFFGNTDICKYLCIYDRLGESHKDKDPRTIATLATFEYVGKWVASQLYITAL